MNAEGEHQGIKVVHRVEHLGTWLGQVSFDDHFAKTLRTFLDKTAFIATLPLTLAQKVEVLGVNLPYPLLCSHAFLPDGCRASAFGCVHALGTGGQAVGSPSGTNDAVKGQGRGVD